MLSHRQPALVVVGTMVVPQPISQLFRDRGTTRRRYGPDQEHFR